MVNHEILYVPLICRQTIFPPVFRFFFGERERVVFSFRFFGDGLHFCAIVELLTRTLSEFFKQTPA